MRLRLRGGVAVVLLLCLGPVAAAAGDSIMFESPSRVDRPGRGNAQARQGTPQIAELSSGPLVVWEDDRDFRLRYIATFRRGDTWTEVDPKLDRVSTTFASDGDGIAWALADSPDGIATRSTRDGRTWEPGPRLIGRHPSRHVLAAAGRDGRLLVARAALDEQNCGRVHLHSNMPSRARRGQGRGLHVGELVRGSVAREAVTLTPSGRFVDVHAAISPQGAGWVAAATLHGIRLYRERSLGVWEPEVVPPVIPAASIQRVRIAPTESEIVVMWQLLRGKDREVVSRAFRLASQSWGEPRLLGPHDGSPTLDATVVSPDRRGDESSVVAVWVSANEVAVAERNRRMWFPSPSPGGGLPESVDLATVDGRAVLAFEARRVDGSTAQPYGAPNTDVFLRARSGEGHWAPAERVDRDVALVKRPGEPRVWTSHRDTFVTFDDDPRGGGVPVVARRVGRGWSEAQPLAVDGEPGEIVLVAPDGGRVLRAADTFVFQDAAGRVIAEVDDVGRENDLVATGTGRFAAATIVGDPGRGEDQRYEIHEVGGDRSHVTRLTVGPTTGVHLYADGRGGAEVVTTTSTPGRDTVRIDARRLRDGRMGELRTIAPSAPVGSTIVSDDAGRLLIASRYDDAIGVNRSDGERRRVVASSPGYQFLIDTSGDHTAVLYSAHRRLVVAHGDGGRFTELPPLPGRFAKITGLGYGYSTSSTGVLIAGPVCFAVTRTQDGDGGMIGWETDVHVTDGGRITVAARHDADVIVARIEPGADEWSYGEAGTRSQRASGDVAIDADGDPIVAWLDVVDGMHRVFASSEAAPSRGAAALAVGATVGALAVLGIALRLRRRVS